MKSMCHVARRNSPSVAERRPTSSCSLTASRIASSSTARSSSASIVSLAKSSRACSSAGGRSRLPTWSARNGGVITGCHGRHRYRPDPCCSATWRSSSHRCSSLPRWSARPSCTGCARARARPRPGAQWCFYGGLALMVATLVSPLAHLSDELFFAHMVEHLLLADLGTLLLVLGLTGPLLAPLLRALPWLQVFGHPVVALTLLGGRTSTSGTCPRSTRARSSTTPSTRSSTSSSCPSGSGCGWRCSARCPSPPGSATARRSATSSPSG